MFKVNKKTLSLSIVWLLLTGCGATAYQSGEGSYTGGFFTSKGPNHLVEISFSANGFTSKETAKTYTFYRCAEYTIQHGKKYFVMYGSLLQASLDKPIAEPALYSIFNKPTAYAILYSLDKPRKGSFEAEKVIAELKDKIKRPDSIDQHL